MGVPLTPISASARDDVTWSTFTAFAARNFSALQDRRRAGRIRGEPFAMNQHGDECDGCKRRSARPHASSAWVQAAQYQYACYIACSYSSFCPCTVEQVNAMFAYCNAL